jgi:TatA/E family protein of Tat protein translocase
MPFGITPLHIIIVLVVALIILGPGRLPKVGSAVGKSVREFRKAAPATRDAFVSEVSRPADPDAPAGPASAAGAQAGSVAGRSVRGFRDALMATKDAFEGEVTGPKTPSATTSAAPAATPSTALAELPATTAPDATPRPDA